ncbi:cytochrome P450 [Aspergillus ambiguus]|uniref:cytochrome P450 n=1 Tax=Aspergillus ambiguus TaxID=176160 RepID=UPI003CCD5789
MDIKLFVVGVGLSVGWLFLRSIYRLYFHPLSNFPGPKLAAISHAYEFYYDGILGGQFMWEIQRMHEKYGPIVRINPRELHIKDPYFFDQIYTSKKQEKDPYFVRLFTVPLAAVSTIDHSHHRLRRETLNPFFSKRAVLGLEHIIHDKVEKVRVALRRAYKNKTVVSLDGIFAALTADVISHYTYGESIGILESEDLKNDFREAVNGASLMCHYTRFVPGVTTILDLIPGVIKWLQPGTKALFNLKDMIERNAVLALKGDLKKGAGSAKTIFDSLVDPSLPAEEKTPRRLRDEAIVVLGAGTETTARVLTVGTFYLYRNPAMLQKLRDELRQVMLEPTSQVALPELEKLPYLTAVVNESLRMAHSVTIRLPRIAPTAVLRYGNYDIPPGTPVSQSIYFVHTDPTVFPHPHKFDPDRWIEAANRGERLTKFLVPFTKGPRICLGLNLAYSELYQMFAALVRGFDLQIHNTTEESIRITRDMMIGLPDSDALEVHGLVSNVVSE